MQIDYIKMLLTFHKLYITQFYKVCVKFSYFHHKLSHALNFERVQA